MFDRSTAVSGKPTHSPIRESTPDCPFLYASTVTHLLTTNGILIAHQRLGRCYGLPTFYKWKGLCQECQKRSPPLPSLQRSARAAIPRHAARLYGLGSV